MLQAHELAPSAGQIVYQLAQIERQLGNNEASDTWLQLRKNQFAPSIADPMLNLVAQYSMNPTFFISAARRAYERGDESTALAAFERALQLAPDNVGYLLDFARLLRSLRRFDEAESVLNSSSQLGANTFDFWYLSYLVNLDLDRLPEALAALEKAIEIDPQEGALKLRTTLKQSLDSHQDDSLSAPLKNAPF